VLAASGFTFRSATYFNTPVVETFAFLARKPGTDPLEADWSASTRYDVYE